jgi:UDP-2-acetamido-2,6-beta-L-arabino-hexul-4-ose reductase
LNILVTGADGFIGKNLVAHLNCLSEYTVSCFTRKDRIKSLYHLVKKSDAIIHLAGENRPKDVSGFNVVNVNLTETVCEEIRKTGRNIPLIFASSIQVNLNNAYGNSKLKAEKIVKDLSTETGNSVYIYRLPNIFGKWCKPNYNSVVATFCYNIANNLPIQISDKSKKLKLVYIDDVILDFIRKVKKKNESNFKVSIEPEYSITLGELASQIHAFRESRKNLMIDSVGVGLIRALYSTYLSYIQPSQLTYDISKKSDKRGIFVEMLKTRDSGQFSYFTTLPGETRGGHYHHSKTEKFLVIKGHAQFKFKHIITNETFELFTSGDNPQIVETTPGWAHNITNIGDNEMIAVLWANEIFNSNSPDTFAWEV